jgi:hypothetical protein
MAGRGSLRDRESPQPLLPSLKLSALQPAAPPRRDRSPPHSPPDHSRPAPGGSALAVAAPLQLPSEHAVLPVLLSHPQRSSSLLGGLSAAGSVDGPIGTVGGAGSMSSSGTVASGAGPGTQSVLCSLPPSLPPSLSLFYSHLSL